MLRTLRSLPAVARQPFVAGGALCLLVILAFFPSFKAGFVWDDIATVLENPFVRSPSGLFSIWFTAHLTDYWPLTYTLYWAEWQLWGDNPFGYHLVNLFLHAGASVVLWRIFRRLNFPGAWLIAAAFAVHPVTVASGAWISEGKNTLSLLLASLSVLWWLRFDAGEAVRWRTLSLIAFVLALLAKTSMVGIPVVLLLLVWWRRSRIASRDIKAALPYFAVALVLGIVTIVFQTSNALENQELPGRGLFERFAATGWAFAFYWLKDLLPFNLPVIYPNWEIDSRNLLHWLPLAGLLALATAAWRNRTAWGRPLLFALLAFGALLLPVLGLIDMAFHRFSLVADHLQYAAVVIPLALVIAGTARYLRSRQAPSWIGVGLACMLLTGLGLLTRNQTRIYESNSSFWSHVSRHNPDAWVAHYHLGKLATGVGSPAIGVTLFEKALSLHERHAGSHVNLGAIFLAQGKIESAEAHLLRALELRPDLPIVHHNLGLLLARKGDLAAASDAFETALSLKPDYAEAFDNLAIVRSLQGRPGDAIAFHKRALELDPAFAKAYLGLGDVYSRTGRLDLAIGAFNQFLRLKPADARARFLLGKTLRTGGQYEEAIPHLAAAIQAHPGVAEGHFELAGALAGSGDRTRAIDELTLALKLDPNLEPAQALLQKLQFPNDAAPR